MPILLYYKQLSQYIRHLARAQNLKVKRSYLTYCTLNSNVTRYVDPGPRESQVVLEDVTLVPPPDGPAPSVVFGAWRRQDAMSLTSSNCSFTNKAATR